MQVIDGMIGGDAAAAQHHPDCLPMTERMLAAVQRKRRERAEAVAMGITRRVVKKTVRQFAAEMGDEYDDDEEQIALN